MNKPFTILWILITLCVFGYCAWERDINCPIICTCQLQHLTETAIYRFMQKEKNKPNADVVEYNEVLYDESMDTIEILEEAHRSIIVRSATCILQTETDPFELIDSLSSNLESLTIIQGYESGNKSIKFSWLNRFERLISLELIGPNVFHKHANNHLLCQIDLSLEHLNYLNLERVLVQNSKEQMQSFFNIFNKSENLTFEYVQKIEGDSHVLTIVQKNNYDEDIVPYEVFKEQRKNNGEVPLFIGFKKLLLLRINNCELSNIYWEMFDGLNELQYLLLENNNLRFIPAFAFYGTPNLKTLSLAHNKLLDIEISDLAGLLELEYLDLTYNNFTQLSELSFPPFPKLKLANFGNNPISIIFPNTFDIMNTTDSMIIGSEDMPLALLPNSFAGLHLLHSLTINNINVEILKRDYFLGMPQLRHLTLTGNISRIEFDAFQEVPKLTNLVLSNCRIIHISMDAFMGLSRLRYLDLSKNELETLPSGVFDQLDNIRELYLNGNKFVQLPRDIFSKINPRLLRLNDNPWHCSCEMSEWKPIIANRIKQKTLKSCDFMNDKGIGCANMENRFEYKYVYDTRIGPKCAKPERFKNWSVFHAMRRNLKCPDYKPKLKKNTPIVYTNTISATANNNIVEEKPATKFRMTKVEKIRMKAKLRKAKYLKYKLNQNQIKNSGVQDNRDNQQISDNQNDLENEIVNIGL
ncbi:uncharacterized protein LOC143197118 [Rhynchophorus ferrugineus]|uniref:uncharacterized protein LOC143197118 n=1 Tax=Rhynchophorus ferrugineus TaxID=354439 RepID=UPI003FCC9014